MSSLTPDNLANKLTIQNVLHHAGSLRQLLSQVMSLTCSSADITPLVPGMVNLLAHSDLLVKKIACQFLVKAAACRSDSMLLAVNTILSDIKDSNPMVRGLALRTLCTVGHEAFLEHRLGSVTKGLDDQSAYVRRAAVSACVTLNRTDHDSLVTSGVVDKLYSMVRDTDPIVVVNCLMVLEEILRDEGGIVVNRSMVKYLLARFSEFDAWNLVYLLGVLKKHVPKCEDEIFNMMDILDPYLKHQSPAVCVHTLELFINLTHDMSHLVLEIFQRSQDSFLGILASGNVEMMAVAIKYLMNYPDICPFVFSSKCKSFFCKHKDPEVLKQLKLNFLSSIINEENFKEIFEEIVMNCSDRSKFISLCAIKALGMIYMKFPNISDSLLKAFKKLLSSNNPHVQSNTLQVLITLPLQNFAILAELSPQLCLLVEKLSDNEGLIAALTLIGDFGAGTPESTYALEYLSGKFSELDLIMKGHLLTVALKLFCFKPAECQKILGSVLEMCLKEDDTDLQDQARFYYSVLEGNSDVLDKLFNVET